MTKSELKEILAVNTEIRTIDQLPESAKKAAEMRQGILLNKLVEFEKRMDALSPTERTVIRLRYINGLSWEMVSRRIHYSKAHLMRIHKAALKKMK